MTAAEREVKNPTWLGQGGFTLLELIVVVAIVAILFTVGLNKYLELLVEVERATMEQNIGIMRSAVAMQVAKKIVGDDLDGLGELAESNPMAYLAEQPQNYLGEFQSADPAAIEGGQWYFEKAGNYLVYRVKNTDYFQGGLAGPKRVRFQIDLVYADHNGSGRFEPKIDALEGLRLAALEPYQWLKKRQAKED
ncbi:MAG: prepilin-type N-terminal cleavage/methylation domain-containing protein [Desulfuromonadales bacterium]|nr:prepilin-type N-terminal cleavage/methylation domain-containing protein [Desulfuromonadales bacterium]MDW7758787.1 prepilin-type N-terminal cleavage/methylation domain-containing protein [Desulfuromonadales bacterium]